MEVDTGAAVTILSESVYQQHLKNVDLQPARIQLQTYTNERLTILGKCHVTLSYNEQTVSGNIYVVPGNGPSLLGRDFLQQVRLDWPAMVHQVNQVTDCQKQLNELLVRYCTVLRDELGTFNGHQAVLHLKEGVTPKYCRPRVVPFALRAAVEKELEKLVEQGILEPVHTSDWATPIVVVPKKDGTIRICGDYKELFASLAGGQKFTKLDLSQAYQQLLLDDKSKELVTINTHKGLFRYNRLPFGVASAPAIFQRTMDNILQGETDADHLKNLDMVLRKLEAHGITVKRSKCQFLYFRKTEKHANADMLSRLPLPTSGSGPSTDVVSHFNLVQMSALPLNHNQLRSSSRRDPVVSKVLLYTLHGWPQLIQEDLKPYWRRRLELSVEMGCLLWGNRTVIPARYQEILLKELHNSHPGIVRMKALARSYFWWPGLDNDIERMVKACNACTQIKSDPSPVVLHPWVWPTRPWSRVHVDFAGPLFGKMYLIVIDAYSKWPEVYKMTSTTAAQTIKVLKQLFTRYGFPEQLVSDNGPQFRSDEFQSFMKQCGVKHMRSAVYHPATNGAVERFVKTLKIALKTGYISGIKLDEVLSHFLFQYRSTPHAVTSSSPSELFLGRPLRTIFDLLRPNQRAAVEDKQVKQKIGHDKGKRVVQWCVGDMVRIRVYRKGLQRWEEGVVKEIIGPRMVKVSLLSGGVVTRHLDQIIDGHSKRSDRLETEELEDWSIEPFQKETGDIAETEPATQPLTQPVDDQNEETTEPDEGESVNPPGSSNRRYPTRIRRAPNRPGFISY